jgi:hypothetical protein
MQTMILNYHIIKYVDDLDTGNEWAIGIIANDGNQAYLRLLGATSRSEVDHTPLCYLTGINAENAWAYREWVDFFFDITDNECSNPAGFEKVMNRLQTTGTTITVEHGGSVEIPSDGDHSSILDQLYAKHVTDY